MKKFLFTGLLAMALVSPTQADQLYLSNGTSLYTFDPVAGTLTLVGPFGAPVWGLASTASGGTIFGTDQLGKQIFTINPNTGQASPVANGPSNLHFASITYTNGALNLVTFGRIYYVNGGSVAIDPGPSFLSSASFGGTIYGADTGGGGNLWVINPANGDADFACINPFQSGVNALAFDAGGVLWAALPDPNGYNTTIFIWNYLTDCSATPVATINGFDAVGMTWR